MRLTIILALAVVTTSASAQSLDPATTSQIDALFARFDRPDTPGCAVGVFQNGAIVYSKGYGSANLEYGVPITPKTPFISGSVAKQFTAGAIALLVEQGRLSLDDDVRKYIPELPDYGAKITVDHLVHHTSGLRDFWALVGVAGMRYDDGYTAGDVIRLASRQKALNFPPGSEYDYSNTGYVSLGIIVQRVTGKSLREFAAEQMFGPLGMTSTQWRDDFRRVVKGRAQAYTRSGSGPWELEMPFENVHGNGGLLTTVSDLLKWNENFVRPVVGDAKLLMQMQTVSRTCACVYSRVVRGAPAMLAMLPQSRKPLVCVSM